MRNKEKGVFSVKKGDYCEAVVETIEFPNKGVLHIDWRKSYCEKCSAGTDDPVCG